eukprot:TRINITY_DN9641_c0_g1_i1.p1 TRINITY_DN9641_c0_g1~~TRINITY_DN9641_c0_g1_i1.p1  ORF type:complete len:400 (+),score=21.49 TRINITY_DN9641_c0_g1_i1:263-1462(+)
MGCGGSKAATPVSSKTVVVDEQHRSKHAVFEGHKDWVKCVDWSADGAYIATGGDDHRVIIWHADTGRHYRTLKQHTEVVWAVKFSRSAKEVASCSNNVILINELSGGLECARLDEHRDIVFAIEWDLKGNDEYIWSASLDQTVQCWHIQSGASVKRVRSIDWNIMDPFAFDLKHGVCAGVESQEDNEAGYIKVWELEFANEVQTYTGHLDAVSGIAYSQDGRYLATTSWDCSAIIWNTKTGSQISVCNGHDGNVKSCVFSHDGSKLLTLSYDKTAKLWLSSAGRLLHTFSGATSAVTCGAFSADDSEVVIGSDDMHIRVYSCHTGDQVLPAPAHVARSRSNLRSNSVSASASRSSLEPGMSRGSLETTSATSLLSTDRTRSSSSVSHMAVTSRSSARQL